MNSTKLILGKYHALKSLLEFVRFFDNWREIWSAYRRSATIPELRFRNGLVIESSSNSMTTFVPDLVTECAAFSRPMAFGAFEISHHLRTQDSEWSKPVGERDTTRCGGGPI